MVVQVLVRLEISFILLVVEPVREATYFSGIIDNQTGGFVPRGGTGNQTRGLRSFLLTKPLTL